MATCPKCQKEIQELDVVVKERCQYSYHDGDVDWSNCGELYEYDIEKFRCPQCYEVITEDRDEADKLLAEEV